jgi:hypothetical protein
LQEIREIKSLDILLPTRDKTIRLRVVATPSAEIKTILTRLKLFLPNRPKIVENVVAKIA